MTPAGTLDPADLLLTYRNFGVVNLAGFDFAVQIHLDKRYAVQLNYLFVSRDLFEDVEGGLDVALNAPRHKAGAGLEYRSLDGKAEAGIRVRFVDGFPVQSGVYVGRVDAYTLADLTGTYEICRTPRSESRYRTCLTTFTRSAWAHRASGARRSCG